MALHIPEKRPEKGFYYHYKHDPAKGPRDYAYYIYEIGFHTEDDCAERDRVMQVYRPLYESAVYAAGKCFDLRPLEMFYEPAQLNGQPVDRFTPITDEATLAELQRVYLEMYPHPF